MEFAQGPTITHFLLFVIYLLFSYSMLSSGKPDPIKLASAILFFSVSMWALGKVVMHNTATSFETARLALKLAIPFNIIFVLSFLMFGLIFWLKPSQKHGYLIIFWMLLVSVPVSILASYHDIFLLKQSPFGWMAVDNPVFDRLYNTFIISNYLLFMVLMTMAIRKGSVFVRRQGALVLIVTILVLVLYFILPSNVFLDNSADLLFLPIICCFYFAIQVFGMFDFTRSEAARVVFENTGEYLALTDYKGRIVSRGGLFSGKEIKDDQDIKTHFYSPESIDDLIKECLEKGSVHSEAILITSKAAVPVTVTATLVKRMNMTVAIAWIITDITERRKFEHKLKTLNEQLEAEVSKRTYDLAKSNEDLEYFAYASYHDLREPLRQIVINLEFLERRLDLKDGQEREIFNFAKEGASRMDELLVAIRNYTAIRKNKFPEETIDMNSCAAKAMAVLKPEIEAKNAVITAGPLPKARGSMELYSSVFKNLISNAMKYNSRRPEVRIYEEAGEICVADNGIGIPAEYRDKVFVIFERLHTESEYSGTGAGLAICRKIIETYGGRIYVQENPAGGSIFRFTFIPA